MLTVQPPITTWKTALDLPFMIATQPLDHLSLENPLSHFWWVQPGTLHQKHMQLPSHLLVMSRQLSLDQLSQKSGQIYSISLSLPPYDHSTLSVIIYTDNCIVILGHNDKNSPLSRINDNNLLLIWSTIFVIAFFQLTNPSTQSTTTLSPMGRKL